MNWTSQLGVKDRRKPVSRCLPPDRHSVAGATQQMLHDLQEGAAGVYHLPCGCAFTAHPCDAHAPAVGIATTPGCTTIRRSRTGPLQISDRSSTDPPPSSSISPHEPASCRPSSDLFPPLLASLNAAHSGDASRRSSNPPDRSRGRTSGSLNSTRAPPCYDISLSHFSTSRAARCRAAGNS